MRRSRRILALMILLTILTMSSDTSRRDWAKAAAGTPEKLTQNFLNDIQRGN